MADTRINEASGDRIDSLHDTNQAVADHFAALQDHNLKFAQNLFLIGLEAVESQAENALHLMDQWVQQLPKQQETFHSLVNATLDVSMNFLRLPFSFSQMRVNATGVETQPAIPRPRRW